MPGGGKIEITAENTSLGKGNELSLDPGRYLRIIIEDSGTGIPSEVQSKIFDPYFTTKPKGSGLGLAVVYSILSNHGGGITVESEQGMGSKFFIYLPATREIVHREVKNAVTGGENSGKIRILVMDDEESVLDVITEILHQNDYLTRRAADGVEAVLMYKEAMMTGEKFDLLIMDITVPGGVGGVDALKRILEFDPSAKAIVASGYANNAIMANYKDFGFVDSIPKPFSIDTLLDTVRNALANG